MSIKIDVSFGELLDKLTILEIKFERIDDEKKIANIKRELEVLTNTWITSGVDVASVDNERIELKHINESLWDIEDAIRRQEAANSFGTEFVSLARNVYKTNDKRSEVKRLVNEKLGSTLIEEKSYQPY
jgi:hypothetical protein